MPTLEEALSGDGRKSPNAPIIIDRSTLERVAECPMQAKLTREGKAIESIEAVSGNEVHRVIAEAIAMRVESWTEPQELREYMDVQIMLSRPDLQPDAVDALKRYTYTLSRLICEHPDGQARDPDDLMRFDGGEGKRSGQLSVEFMKGTEDRGPVIITCGVDLLLAGPTPAQVKLVDWKTGRKRWTQDLVAESFQFGTFYPYLVMRNYPDVQFVDVEIHMPRLYDFTPPWRFTEKHMDAAHARIYRAVQQYLDDMSNPEHTPAWPARGKCEICDVVMDCPAANAIPSATAFKKSPEAYLRAFQAKLAQVAEMSSVLKGYVKEHGDLVFNGERGPVAFGVEAPKAKRFSPKIYTPGEAED